MKLKEVADEIMTIVRGRDEDTCLDIAERVADLLSDIPLGYMQDGWSAEECVDYIELRVYPNLAFLIKKLEKEENDKRNKNTD